MRFILLLMIVFIANNTFADEAAKQAKAFTDAYLGLCMKHLNNLGTLRERLAPVPTLEADKAAHFLQGKEGDAWPVPSNFEPIVLALPAANNLCALYTRQVDAQKVQSHFSRLVAEAPSSLIARLVRDEYQESETNGLTHTVAYEWRKPNAPYAMLFTLTTASGENSHLQAMASATLVRSE